MSEDILALIDKQVKSNEVILYMKGEPEAPQCGFSARAVEILKACGATFAHVDVLAEPDIRQHLPSYQDWPTFPQLYIKGELVGGSDIMWQQYQSGELQSLL